MPARCMIVATGSGTATRTLLFVMKDYPDPPEVLEVIGPGELVQRVRKQLAKRMESE